MPQGKNGIYKYEPLWNEWYVEELIGKGSYGEVYKIYRDVGGKREYAAAKYISIPKADDRKNYRQYSQKELTTFFEDRADKFSIEISSMLKLKDSKNVVHYEQHIKEKKKDEIGWDIIIRMELLTSLEDYLDENAFYKKDVVKLGIDICAAIESCQKNNIIHRDIKIENIFLDAFNNYKLGDFGVSREGNGTATGTVTGTAAYMAPEISKDKKYNGTVDIYALGIAMYQLLNNRRNPFIDADKVPTTDDEANAQFKRENGAEFPNPKFDSWELARIIKKACAYEPHKRYENPREMADELKKVLQTIDDEIVLEKREKFDFDGETVHEKIDGDGNDKTVHEKIDGEDNSEGTVYENPPVSIKKKSKKPLLIGSIAAVVCALALIIVLNIPKNIPITGIDNLPEETTQMVIGDTLELGTVKKPADATDNLTYESSDEQVATVDENGVITALAKGEVTITIKGDDIVKTITVNIEEKRIPVTAITGNMSDTMTLTAGENTQLICSVVPENATEQTITYSSSDGNVATIGQDGVITAVNPGHTTITASAADGITKQMSLTVNAKAQPKQNTTPNGNTTTKKNTNNNTNTNKNTNSGNNSNYIPPQNNTSSVENTTKNTGESENHTTPRQETVKCPVCGSKYHSVHPNSEAPIIEKKFD